MYEEYLTSALVGIINAKQALKNYQETGIKALKNTSAYNIQQALEFIIKYRIYNCPKYNQGSSTIKQIFSHDLDMLIKSYCIPFGIVIPKPIEKNARMYTSWESESRYRLGFSVRITSLEKAIQETEKWLIVIKPSYQKKISQVNKRLML